MNGIIARMVWGWFPMNMRVCNISIKEVLICLPKHPPFFLPRHQNQNHNFDQWYSYYHIWNRPFPKIAYLTRGWSEPHVKKCPRFLPRTSLSGRKVGELNVPGGFWVSISQQHSTSVQNVESRPAWHLRYSTTFKENEIFNKEICQSNDYHFLLALLSEL